MFEQCLAGYATFGLTVMALALGTLTCAYRFPYPGVMPDPRQPKFEEARNIGIASFFLWPIAILVIVAYWLYWLYGQLIAQFFPPGR